MATAALPLVLPPVGEDPRQIQTGEYIAGTAGWLTLLSAGANLSINLAAGIELTLSSCEFAWDRNYLPTGLQLYLEINGQVVLATSSLNVYLATAAGAAVPNASVSLATTVPSRPRTSLPFSLVHGTVYQVRAKAGLLSAATLTSIRLLFLP